MIFGHEGGVRAGKSYEAVLYHILPAIKAGRHVYARLNGIGENVAAIAAHLEMKEEEVAALVHPMGTSQVHEWLVADEADDGTLTFPHIPMHSLVVVDEAHDFWPVGRAGLPDRTSSFFAKHGHISLDIVVITQDIKELHRSVVRRITKKNFYAKLDSLGKDQSYSVRFYSSPLPGKFELIGSEKRDYDPVVWSLYHGVQPGVEGNQVYKSNTRTLWQTIRKPALLLGAALIVGLFFIGRFFTGGWSEDLGAGKPAEEAPEPVGHVYQPQAQQPVQPVVSQPEVVKPEPKRPPGIEHLLEIRKKARARYLGVLGDHHLVEFRPETGHVLERLTAAQMRALGWTVEVTGYGMIATYDDQAIVFTPWPVEPLGRLSDATLSAIGAAGPPVMSASESQPATAAHGSTSSGSGTRSASGPDQIGAYGGFRQ